MPCILPSLRPQLWVNQCGQAWETKVLSLSASFLPEPRYEQRNEQLGTLTLPESHRQTRLRSKVLTGIGGNLRSGYRTGLSP